MKKVFLFILAFYAPLWSLPLLSHHDEDIQLSYPDEHHLEIRLTKNTLLEFDELQLAANETISIYGPSDECAVYMRINSAETLTNIQGSIRTNAHLLLYTPYGCVLGHKSSIKAQSFIGTTLEVPLDTFFKNPTGAHFYAGREQALFLVLGSITTHTNKIQIVSYEVIIPSKNNPITITSFCQHSTFYPELMEKYGLDGELFQK